MPATCLLDFIIHILHIAFHSNDLALQDFSIHLSKIEAGPCNYFYFTLVTLSRKLHTIEDMIAKEASILIGEHGIRKSKNFREGEREGERGRGGRVARVARVGKFSKRGIWGNFHKRHVK